MLSTIGAYNDAQRPKQASRMQFTRAAPWFSVPPRAIVSIEHPFIVKDNISKVVASLGGNDVIEKV